MKEKGMLSMIKFYILFEFHIPGIFLSIQNIKKEDFRISQKEKINSTEQSSSINNSNLEDFDIYKSGSSKIFVNSTQNLMLPIHGGNQNQKTEELDNIYHIKKQNLINISSRLKSSIEKKIKENQLIFEKNNLARHLNSESCHKYHFENQSINKPIIINKQKTIDENKRQAEQFETLTSKLKATTQDSDNKEELIKENLIDKKRKLLKFENKKIIENKTEIHIDEKLKSEDMIIAENEVCNILKGFTFIGSSLRNLMKSFQETSRILAIKIVESNQDSKKITHKIVVKRSFVKNYSENNINNKEKNITAEHMHKNTYILESKNGIIDKKFKSRKRAINSKNNAEFLYKKVKKDDIFFENDKLITDKQNENVLYQPEFYFSFKKLQLKDFYDKLINFFFENNESGETVCRKIFFILILIIPEYLIVFDKLKCNNINDLIKKCERDTQEKIIINFNENEFYFHYNNMINKLKKQYYRKLKKFCSEQENDNKSDQKDKKIDIFFLFSLLNNKLQHEIFYFKTKLLEIAKIIYEKHNIDCYRSIIKTRGDSLISKRILFGISYYTLSFLSFLLDSKHLIKYKIMEKNVKCHGKKCTKIKKVFKSKTSDLNSDKNLVNYTINYSYRKNIISINAFLKSKKFLKLLSSNYFRFFNSIVFRSFLGKKNEQMENFIGSTKCVKIKNRNIYFLYKKLSFFKNLDFYKKIDYKFEKSTAIGKNFGKNDFIVDNIYSEKDRKKTFYLCLKSTSYLNNYINSFFHEIMLKFD